MPGSMSNAHALLIGVGSYEYVGFNNLPVTVTDAEGLRDVLVDPTRCGYPREQVRMLTNKQATLPQIRAGLEHLALARGAGSVAVVFFSGHGWRLVDEQMSIGKRCPREADLLDMEHTALPEAEFSEAIRALRAEKVVVILDCCHAGSTARFKGSVPTANWKSGLPESFYSVLRQGSGRVIIASCKENEQSYVRKQADYSYFSYFLIQALSGAIGVGRGGLIHVMDAFDYAAAETSRAVLADLGPEAHQNPLFKADNLDSNFAIALSQETSPFLLVPAPRQPVAYVSQHIEHMEADTINNYNADTMNFTSYGTPRKRTRHHQDDGE